MANNEEQGKCGDQHERIGDFLRTNATLTWQWQGNDYFAQYRGQTDTVFITLNR